MCGTLKMDLQNLPDVVIEKIFSFLSFDEIARNRLVCRRFNGLGWLMLNRGYRMAERFHNMTLRAIKTRLPRRESERRSHPLSRQCDILLAIETRMSMLSMTFSKWIDLQQCCFIPGKVIDEIVKMLRSVNVAPMAQRPQEVLQELRDISSMAMEHFDENIAPAIKAKLASQPPKFSSTYMRLIQCNADKVENLSSKAPDVIVKKGLINRNSNCGYGCSLFWPCFKKQATACKWRSRATRKLLLAQGQQIVNMKAMNQIQGKLILKLRKDMKEMEAKLRDHTVEMIRLRQPSNTTAGIQNLPLKRKAENEAGDLCPPAKMFRDATDSITNGLNYG